MPVLWSCSNSSTEILAAKVSGIYPFGYIGNLGDSHPARNLDDGHRPCLGSHFAIFTNSGSYLCITSLAPARANWQTRCTKVGRRDKFQFGNDSMAGFARVQEPRSRSSLTTICTEMHRAGVIADASSVGHYLKRSFQHVQSFCVVRAFNKFLCLECLTA
jgi:hypothetical protein